MSEQDRALLPRRSVVVRGVVVPSTAAVKHQSHQPNSDRNCRDGAQSHCHITVGRHRRCRCPDIHSIANDDSQQTEQYRDDNPVGTAHGSPPMQFAERRYKDAGRIDLPWLDQRRVKFVTPNARLSPIWPSTDSGCRIMERRDPPISTLAPRPRPTATLPLAPT